MRTKQPEETVETVEEMFDHRIMDIHPNKGTSIYSYLVNVYTLTGH